ncbi:hypothetical protein N7497_007427 [Penicillium chrysogenum]|uniref:ATP-grasp domain-containing protein n=1 Tax=Penicillium chrysogenum TaxID=5076 RepID=A0ABQ8W340_PENCH|nr:hypothetical protein N7505_010246 [Penicillium chrysogenum]KAJ5276129.1 hypothetical protein N7524_002282 [Penicillium chrysogenum]KAJ6153108.1 hypothetical protein N7497_007427 [Penicillium chrysogenum]
MGESNGSTSLRVALISEQRPNYLQLGYSEEDCAALTHDGEIQAVLSTLKKLGHQVTLVPGIESLVQQLAAGKHKCWDLAFNMAQGFHGPARESQVPALLGAYQVPHTFADAATMALCQNKANTKMVLNHHNIPTAPFLVIPASEPADSLIKFTTSGLQYPLFVKPVTEGSSKGIDGFNKVKNPAELEPAVHQLRSKFPAEDILVEPFLSGREFTVGILGAGEDSRVIGVREFIWKKPSADFTNGVDGHPDLEFASRWSKSSRNKLIPRDQDLTHPQVQAACRVSLDAWKVFGCRDAGRVDIRFDSDEPDAVPNILEVNPISGLLPDHSPLPACAESNGISYAELLGAIIESALRRCGTTFLTNGSS